jgi:electron transport complex protein RnfG
LALLGLIGLGAAVTLGGIDELTRSTIDDQRRAYALRAVSAILAGRNHDNDLLDSARPIDIDGLEATTVYTARLDGQPVAAVFDVTTPRGYSGDIRLLVAVDDGGDVLGVRVLEHRETPGLGDRIESGRSDWLEQFEGKSLGNPSRDRWAPDRRDGAFDTVTSATITSSAVIDAVKRVLATFESHRNRVFAESGPANANGPD